MTGTSLDVVCDVIADVNSETRALLLLNWLVIIRHYVKKPNMAYFALGNRKGGIILMLS